VIRLQKLGIGIVLLLAASPAMADAMPDVPRHIITVRNTTNVALTCRLQVDGKTAETLLFAPGQEWQRRVTSTTSAGSMSCAAPVKRVLFQLSPGRRYFLIRSLTKEGYLRGGKQDFGKGGAMISVDLRDVTTGK
jgi:hypothetical protein